MFAPGVCLLFNEAVQKTMYFIEIISPYHRVGKSLDDERWEKNQVS